MRRLNCIPSESAHRRGDPAKLSTAVISYAVTFDGYPVEVRNAQNVRIKVNFYTKAKSLGRYPCGYRLRLFFVAFYSTPSALNTASSAL